MKYIVCLVLVFRLVEGGCPRASFEFYNQTVKTRYSFIDSSVGNIGSLETCPYTGRPFIYLPCYPNSSWGDEPYFSACLKPIERKTPSIPSTIAPSFPLSIADIAKLPVNNSDEISSVLSYLNQETMTFESSADIASVVNIIDRITTNNQSVNEQTHSNYYSIASKLLSSKSMPQIQEAQRLNQSIVKLLSSLESYSQNIRSDQTFIEKNFRVSIINMPNNRTKPIVGFAYDSGTNRTFPIVSDDRIENSTMITLQSDVLSRQNRLAFAIYDHRTGLFNQNDYQILTPVISLTVDQTHVLTDLEAFVKMTFHLDREVQGNLTCAYWHIFENMTAQWSTDGCRLSNRTDRDVMCECNHLTHFAVLMDFEQTPTPKIVAQILSMITLTGLSLSSLGLCLTILTFVLFKKLRRHFSQKSLLFLAINLLCVNILFAMLGLFTSERLSCIIIASLLHYFILSSFSWMFIMALIQYLLFVRVFPQSISAFTRKAAAFAQLLPIIPVAVVLGLNPMNYTKGASGICWLSHLPLYLSFFLPILLYIIINSILFSMVAYTLLCGKTGQQLRSTHTVESQRLSRFSVALSCFVVLGLTWTFGFLALGPVRILFQILFCTFASLTGFFIFLLYIVTSKAKRTCWNNAFKSLGVPSIYSPAMSSSSGFTSGKDYPTSSTNDQQKLSLRFAQFPSQPQHFIDAYMPSSPPPPAPAPPLPLPPHFLLDGDDSLHSTTMPSHFHEPRQIWTPPPPTYIYQINQSTTSLDDFPPFHTVNHDATKF